MFKAVVNQQSLKNLHDAILKKTNSLPPIGIGVLKDIRYNPRQSIKPYANEIARKVMQGPRKKGKTVAHITNGEIANTLEKKYGIFSKPLKNKNTTQTITHFYKVLWDKGLQNAPLNSIRALFSQPLVEGKYGHNIKKIQGQNKVFRNGLDTGQFHQSLAVQCGSIIYPKKGNL